MKHRKYRMEFPVSTDNQHRKFMKKHLLETYAINIEEDKRVETKRRKVVVPSHNGIDEYVDEIRPQQKYQI